MCTTTLNVSQTALRLTPDTGCLVVVTYSPIASLRMLSATKFIAGSLEAGAAAVLPPEEEAEEVESVGDGADEAQAGAGAPAAAPGP